MIVFLNRRKHVIAKRVCSFVLAFAFMLTLSLYFKTTAYSASATAMTSGATVKSLTLTLREGASASSSVLATLKQGDYLSVTAYTGAWAQVEYNDGLKRVSGYAAIRYLNISAGTIRADAPLSLNVSALSGTYELSWKIINGISKYAIYRSEDGGEHELHTILTTKAESLCRYTPLGLNPGSVYTFMVAAVRDNGQIGYLTMSARSVSEEIQSEYICPLNSSYVISSPYGERNGKQHTGVDMAAPEGTPIYAVREGTVIRSGVYSSYGYCVDIDHGSGVVTRYAHCSELLVSVGDYVAQGALIALVGKTGNATGSHLHFEIRINNTPVSPMIALQ